nr:carboxypeptidase-like regulatory domain-containing protein [uncultured Carboxylicivirga sp.]
MINESNTQNPVPFVNISIKNTYLGTITDASGNYKLVIPSKYINAAVCFSCIGYESIELKVSELLKDGNICLTPSNEHLLEVTIMPDSTLRSFLRKAYEKIPENYPSYSTQQEAFYREGIQNANKQYLRLVEAIIKANKSSYKKSQSGTVQLIESRKYIDTDSSKSFPISFYGGPHFIHTLDCVKDRYDFIKVHTDYVYMYDGLTSYNGEKVHKISFQPKNGSNKPFQGTMYIHVETLSYLRFDFSLTDEALKKRFISSIQPGFGLKSTEKTYIVNYQLFDSVCFLKSIYENERIETKEGDIFYSPLEMVVTKNKAGNIAAIPYNCQIQLGYVPDREATDYYRSNWKNYNTLTKAEVIDTLVSKRYFSSTNQQSIKKHQLIDLLKKLDLSYKVSYQPYHLSPGKRQLAYQDINYNKNISNEGTTIALDMLLAYNISKRFNVGYIVETGFSEANLQDKQGPQLAYKIPLKTMGNNVIFEPQIAYVWHSFGRSVGTQSFDNSFQFGGKKFKNTKVEALPGIKHHGFQAGGSLLYQLSSIVYLDIQANYYMPSKTTELLFFKERSGFFLFRKTAHESLTDTDASLSIDGIQTFKSGVSYDNWSISAGIRLMF